ncbi:MAG: acetyl-CoA C-acyltransferase, partial [Myxococcota bacterium]
MGTAYIYDAVRTPRSKGKATGTLHEIKPVQLAAGLLRELQGRHDLDTSKVDDVVLGCVTPVGDQGSNIAKAASQAAGWDQSVAGVQMDRFCASGLEAVNSAAAKIGVGWQEMVVAGGVESMSRSPMGANGGAMMTDADFVVNQRSVPQGIGADLIATLDGYSRETVDAFAAESQRRASYARAQGWFDRSVVAVKDRNGMTVLERDDYIRPGTT